MENKKIEKLKRDGWEFVGIDEEGLYNMRRGEEKKKFKFEEEN